MMLNRLRQYVCAYAMPQLSLLIIIGITWGVFSFPNYSPEGVKQDDLKATIAKLSIGSIVILDSQSASIRQQLMEQSVEVYDVIPFITLEKAIEQLLQDKYCQNITSKAVYFLWTNDGGKDIYNVGSEARILSLFFTLSPQNISNHLFFLQPRMDMIQRYCALQPVGNGPLLMIIRDHDDSGESRRIPYGRWNNVLSLGKVVWSINQPARFLVEDVEKIKSQNGTIMIDQAVAGFIPEYPIIQLTPFVAYYGAGWYEYEREQQMIWFNQTVPDEPMWASTPKNGLWARSPATIVLYSPQDQKVSLHMRLRYLYSKDPGLMKIQINEKIGLTNKVSTEKTFKADIDLQEGWNTLTLSLGAGNFRPIRSSPLSLDFRLLSFSVKEIKFVPLK